MMKFSSLVLASDIINSFSCGGSKCSWCGWALLHGRLYTGQKPTIFMYSRNPWGSVRIHRIQNDHAWFSWWDAQVFTECKQYSHVCIDNAWCDGRIKLHAKCLNHRNMLWDQHAMHDCWIRLHYRKVILIKRTPHLTKLLRAYKKTNITLLTPILCACSFRASMSRCFAILFSFMVSVLV